jgi:4-oxalomesaconate hydratase
MADHKQRLLVVAAHPGDFVWRSAGILAAAVANGGDARVVCLSYGARGESGELWKEEGQTLDNVKRIRDEESREAAAVLGASFSCFDLDDYPIRITPEVEDGLVDAILEFAPTHLITHAREDPFNPDHPAAFQAANQARMLSGGAGVASAFPRVSPPQMLLFEPHQPELCAFTPDLFVDITPVIELKVKAMNAMGAQNYLKQYYLERAQQRANHARRISGRKDIDYAEAFQRLLPDVVSAL